MKQFSKEHLDDAGINKKTFIGQFLCKHENTQWFGERTLWLGGQDNYEICTDCGKTLKIYCERY